MNFISNANHYSDVTGSSGRSSPDWIVAAALGTVIALSSAGCASSRPSLPSKAAASTGQAAPAPVDFGPYLTTLAQLAPGDTDRQATAMTAARDAAQQLPSASNRLRYALALGSASHPGSDPVAGRQLITELLAGVNDLSRQEIEFAEAFLREFDARVALYADNARQREEFEEKTQAAMAEDNRRLAALGAENQRLRRSLAEAERKLSAVAEMERSLLQNGAEPPADDTRPPQ